MGFTTGTASRNNANLRFRFRFNGTDIAWAQPYKINDFSNSGETVDGKFRISDLDVQFVDINGSYFATQFGRGTVGFGSSLEVVAYLGGTYEFGQHGVNMQAPQWLGSAGANFATIHTGNIYNISFSDRLLRLRSKNRLAVLSSLKLQFPIEQSVDGIRSTGSALFFTGNIADDYRKSALTNFEDNNTRWECSGYYIDPPAGVTNYPSLFGRQTGTTASGFYWAGTDVGGTNFYDAFSLIRFRGTYFGTLVGTITSDESAFGYGYVDRDEADRLKSNATTYVINKSRLTSSGTLKGNYLYLAAPFTISGSPTEVLQKLIGGAIVTPLFSLSDFDATTLSSSGTILAYSYYTQTFYPNLYDNPLESIKSIIQTTQALFSVNSGNKFEYRAYGPKNLTASIPSFGTSAMVSSDFQNDESDFFNRFIIKHAWDGTNTFLGILETKSPTWSKDYDAPLTIESKWIDNPNEATILSQRLLSRYSRTFPHINVRTNINTLGYDIGTLISVTDPNSGISNKVVQVVGFSKKWMDREIEFICWDAESLYQRRGYAFWENDGFPVTGSETSSAIWGNTYGTINTSVYGSQFSWW